MSAASPLLQRLEGLLTLWKGAPTSPGSSGVALAHRELRWAGESALAVLWCRVCAGSALCHGSHRGVSHWFTF